MRKRNVSTLVIMFAVVAACLVLMALRIGGDWITVLLACGVILVSSSIAAMLSATRQSRVYGRRSERHYMALTVVAGLLGTSTGAMVVLVVVTEPLELIKTALGGVIVLAGFGISAVLAMSRADAAGHKDDEAGRQASAAGLEAASAKHSAEAARSSADGADRRASEARDEARLIAESE